MARHTRRDPVELTERQQEILTVAKKGLTVAEASKHLGIAESGIYNHTRRIREKGHAIEWAKESSGAAAPAEAAPTNGGGPSVNADITAAAKAALGNDAEQYVAALGTLASECQHRIEEIDAQVEELSTERRELSERITDLSARQESARAIADQIATLV